MSSAPDSVLLNVETTSSSSPIGETVGRQNMKEGKIPVFSCEGACIRGEIARVAANLVAKEEPYRRGCHGELLTVPHSAIARWARSADRAVVIDGCFLRCHGRILRGLFEPGRLIDIDGVPEQERNEVARAVADWVLETL